MNKISIIIAREYKTRVRKKSFIITTLITPLLMAAIIILTVYFSFQGGAKYKKIAVIEDGTGLFNGAIKNNSEAEFIYMDGVPLDDLKRTFEEAGYYGILYISSELVTTPNAVQLISKKQPPISLVEYINSSLKKEIERQKLLTYHIENLDNILKQINTSVSVQTVRIDDQGATRETSTGIAMALSYIGGILMYILVFLFGSMVMRGVLEEKTSRVVEVIISSVKPVQLMLGKIIGVALVGLTQFVIWIVFTFALIGGATAFVGIKEAGSVTKMISEVTSQDVMNSEQIVAEEIAEVADMPDMVKMYDNLKNQNWTLIIFSFLFFFIMGYLLYASLFAAVSSAVDNETDTQQFVAPITIPVVFAFLVSISVMNNPESQLAFWCSIIPFTSPIVMMALIPFDVPVWQLVLSMSLMLVTIVGVMWMAAKIYRTGILMYGKKVTWRELWKWLKYKG